MDLCQISCSGCYVNACYVIILCQMLKIRIGLIIQTMVAELSIALGARRSSTRKSIEPLTQVSVYLDDWLLMYNLCTYG